MGNQVLNLADFYSLLYRKRFQSFFILISCFAFVFSIQFFLTKKYKSHAILNVYSSYFKNPMVREIIPELHAQDEIRYNVFAIIKNSIDDEFLFSLSKRQKGLVPLDFLVSRSETVSWLRKRFDLTTLSPQIFRISFYHSNPDIAKKVTEKALSKIINDLKAGRKKTISDLMDAMKKRIEILNLTSSDETTPLFSRSPELINEELSRLRLSIEALKKEYSDQHPLLKNLIAKKSILDKWVENKNVTKSDIEKVPVLGRRSKEITRELVKDFLKKYNYLRVSFDVENKGLPDYLSVSQYPKSPSVAIWPKPIVFVVMGLFSGILLALLNLIFIQFMSTSRDDLLKTIERVFDTKLLGELPKFEENLVRPKNKRQEPTQSEKSQDDGPIKWN